MKCKKCNEKSHPHGAIYCHVCGKPLQKNNSATMRTVGRIVALTIMLIIPLTTAIVLSLSEIMDLRTPQAYFAVYGNVSLLIAAFLECYSENDEDWRPITVLLVCGASSIFMIVIYALAYYLPDVWSIPIEMVLIAIFFEFVEFLVH